MNVLRAPFMYYGGKGNMLGKLLPLVPPGGKPYCEPYCGAASLFFAREPAPVEVLNDLNEEIVNFFRCIQDKEKFEELKHRIYWTLYSRAEFEKAINIGKDADDVTRAWATFVKLNQSMPHTTECLTVGDWSRNFITVGNMANNTSKWIMRQKLFDQWRERLMRVQIDCRDALEVIEYWDNPEAIFYVDPPYHPDTRKDTSVYSHETDEKHHEKLVELLLKCKGIVVLSGYDHEVYKPLTEAGWEKIEFKTAAFAPRGRGSKIMGENSAFGKVPRIEVVWRNTNIKKKGQLSLL